MFWADSYIIISVKISTFTLMKNKKTFSVLYKSFDTIRIPYEVVKEF